MAKYVMQEMPDVRGTGERVKYPRLLIDGQIDLRGLADEIARRSSLTRGDVEASVGMLTEVMAEYMARGYSVRIDGLGLFTPKLSLKDGVERETEGGSKRNSMSIEVSDVRFAADRQLVGSTHRACVLERAKAERYVKPTEGREERLARLLDYLAHTPSIGVSTYARLMGLSQTSAQRELRHWSKEGIIGQDGLHSHKRYTLPRSVEDE